MRYIIPVTLGVVVFVYGLIDCLRSEPSDVRSIPKTAWVLVIVLLNVIGVGLWFLFGRPQYAASAPAGRNAGPAGGTSGGYSAPRGAASRSMAPDDDPQFLRNLEINRAQKLEAERLRKLKAELDAREAKLRDQQAKPKDEPKK